MVTEANQLREKVLTAIDRYANELIRLGELIYAHPETGYKEYATTKVIADQCRAWGISHETFSNIPGLKAVLDTGKPGPAIAILGELDAIICSDHPHSSRENGAIHACGHNLQICGMLGAGIGLMEAGVLDELCGKIILIAVPAEELIEIDERNAWRQQGSIHYMTGKPELLWRNVFDEVDISIMVHSFSSSAKFALEPSCNGCLVKQVRYIGKAAHAGDAPHEGINALYAAQIGMSAINAIRETFRSEAYVRVHPIITKGGEAINVIPAEVCVETYVRGKTMKDIIETNQRVDQALASGALALGAEIEITDFPGFYPLVPNENLQCLAAKIMSELTDGQGPLLLPHATGSTDMGDLSALMPVIHPYVGGVSGSIHGADYTVIDKETAYLQGAKLLSSLVVELLRDGAISAEDIIKGHKPVFQSKQDYFDCVDQLYSKKKYPPFHW